MVTYNNTSDATTIINRAAAEVGLTPVTNPYSTADAAFTQLTYLLNSVGQELVRSHNWNFLRRRATFTTVNAQANYAYETDQLRFYNNTFWDETDDEPLLGPLSPQEWATLESEAVAAPAETYFRVFDGEIQIYPTPVTSDLKDIAYEYLANSWVLLADNTTYAREVANNDDKVLFDELLVVQALKVKFLIAKGLDATAAQDDYNQTFELLTSAEQPSRDIHIGNSSGYPYLDPITNVRDTGYGG